MTQIVNLRYFLFVIAVITIDLSCRSSTQKEESDFQYRKTVESLVNYLANGTDLDTTAFQQNLDSTFKPNGSFNNPMDECVYDVFRATWNGNAIATINKHSNQYFQNAFRLLKNKSKRNNIEVWTNVNYAWYCYMGRDMQNALKYYSKVIQKLPVMPSEDVIDPVNTYKHIGYFLGTINETDSSISYLKKAISFCQNTGQHKLKSEILDNIGQYYLFLKNYSAAMNYQDSALHEVLKTNDSSRLAKILGNQARLFLQQNQYAKAITLLKQDILISERMKDSLNLMFADNLLSDAYWGNKNVGQALSYLNKSLAIAQYYPNLQSDEFNFLKKKLECIRQAHLPIDTTAMLLRMGALRDVIDHTDGQNAIDLVRMGYTNTLYAAEGDKVAASLQKERAFKRVYGLLAMLLLGVIFWVVRTYRKQIKISEESFEDTLRKIEIKKADSEQKWAEANQDLASYLVLLNERNSHIEELKEELEKHKQNHSEANNYPSSRLDEILQTHLITEENWLNFKRAFIHENLDFYNELIGSYPGLTESNLRIIFLSKLTLKNQEIANILGVSYDAVKKAKQRLRSRLGLDLATFLHQVEE